MNELKPKYDYIVAGSGTGGGTLVRELAKNDKDVLCIEWGEPAPKVGEMLDCRYFYDFNLKSSVAPARP